MPERMKSLADVLGVEDPQGPDLTVPDFSEHLTAKDLSLELLNSRQYRESLLRRIMWDELPPAVECKLMDYAWGRPVERVQVEDKTPRLGDLTSAQLEEQALRLASLARDLRMREERGHDGGVEESVH